MVTAPRRAGRFGAVVTAMVTPFDAEGRVDIDGAVALARYLVDNGSDGLLVTGTTGEGPDPERLGAHTALGSRGGRGHGRRSSPARGRTTRPTP